jgi:DNA-binding LytR/AlgR family response regulator
MKAIVIEDDPRMREYIVRCLSRIKPVKVVKRVDSVKKAFEAIVEHRPEVLFLDIELTGGDAFDLLDQLKNGNIDIPALVMTTAYPEKYADTLFNQGYKEYVIRHLAKNRLRELPKTLSEAVEAVQQHLKKTQKKTHLALSAEEGIFFVKLANIAFLEVGEKSHTIIVSNELGFDKTTSIVENQITTTRSMAALLDSLPSFKRISRTHAVNRTAVRQLKKATDRTSRTVEVEINGKLQALEIGDDYYDNFKSWLSESEEAI